MKEVVSLCSHGIDLHTGARHRSNLPQIRADLEAPETKRLAQAFGVPVLLNAGLRDGSLRSSAGEQGVAMLLYEGGEALRFDEFAIHAGVRGVINVMRELRMLPQRKQRQRAVPEPFVARGSRWVRAPESGVVRQVLDLGKRVKVGDTIAVIASPLGENELEVCSAVEGVIIGRSTIPLVHAGEALVHIATFEKGDGIDESIEVLRREFVRAYDEEGD